MIITADDYVSSSQGRECVCSFDANADYFPIKVSPQRSTLWSVTYHKSYKVVENKADKTSYVAYLCGTPVPQLTGTLEGAKLVEIPIKTAAVLPSVIVPFVEYIGRRESIVYTGTQNIQSNCIAKLTQDSKIEALSLYGTGFSVLAASPPDAVFCDTGDWGSCKSGQGSGLLDNVTTISVAQHLESSLFGDVEWVEYLSLFYNREKAAKDVVDNIEARFECEKKKVTEVAGNKVKVCWANYYPNKHVDGNASWSVGADCSVSDAAWYCPIAEAAGIEVIGRQQYSPTKSGHPYKYLTDEEFASGPCKDADMWFYPASNFLETDHYGTTAAIADKLDVLKRISAYNAGNVFDNMANGPYDWFESRIAEPDVLLMDFIKAFRPDVALDHKRVWLRKVLGTVEAVGKAGDASKCVDPSANLFTKWTTGGCAGEGNMMVIGGLKLPGKFVETKDCGMSAAEDASTTQASATRKDVAKLNPAATTGTSVAAMCAALATVMVVINGMI